VVGWDSGVIGEGGSGGGGGGDDGGRADTSVAGDPLPSLQLSLQMRRQKTHTTEPKQRLSTGRTRRIGFMYRME